MKHINKIIIISLIIGIFNSLLALGLQSIENLSLYPLNINQVSKSRGGNLNDKIAINDGIGTILLGSLNLNHNLSNQPINNLIINNKKIILDNPNNVNNPINNLINNNIITNDNGQLNNINDNIFLIQLNNTHINGSICIKTNYVNTTWLNDICQGGNLIGSICDDNNVNTINDKWQSDGTCVGTNIYPNGSTCNKTNYVNTTWLNGICQGGNLIGSICDDNNVNTINDKWQSNGICLGTSTTANGMPCNDNNQYTQNDHYQNNICIGDALLASDFQFCTNVNISSTCNNLDVNIIENLSSISKGSGENANYGFKFNNHTYSLANYSTYTEKISDTGNSYHYIGGNTVQNNHIAFSITNLAKIGGASGYWTYTQSINIYRESIGIEIGPFKYFFKVCRNGSCLDSWNSNTSIKTFPIVWDYSNYKMRNATWSASLIKVIKLY